MRRRDGKTAIRCARCPRMTASPRKGLCFACYQRTRRDHATDVDCAACGTTDVRVLRRHRLVGSGTAVMWTLCANDAAIAGKRRITIDELIAERFPPGDRRARDRRRGDRRGPERRTRVDVNALLEDEKRKGRRR